jgi:hypothetical protein
MQERQVLLKLKAGAEEVLKELERRESSMMLLRAGSGNDHHHKQLLRSSGVEPDTGSEQLLRISEQNPKNGRR